MRTVPRPFGLLYAMPAVMLHAWAQTPFPDHVIQNVTWSTGTHHVAVAQPLRAPGVPSAPVTISGYADAELVSATQVRLTDGFHAGAFAGTGRFRAYIDAGAGPAADLVLIAPEPATHVTGEGLAVPKWEKVELGLGLPEVYRDAIAGFYARYYSNGPENPVTPDLLDRAHDLNPYADDSLLLLLHLTSPSGVQKLKWGFYMKEAQWSDPADPIAVLEESTGGPLDPYNVRFRFAPDEEGLWQFAITVRAPHTLSSTHDPLPDLHYADYSLECTAPLPDNHGYLEVHPVNRRILRFQDGTPFFGMGVNMADTRHWYMQGVPSDWWRQFYMQDLDQMTVSMERLAGVGGNFMRMFLMPYLFAPEWVNAGVYDAYKVPLLCDQSFSANCNVFDATGHEGNCQTQAKGFDILLEHARDHSIYLQLCIDPYLTGAAYETFLWGAHPLVRHFAEANASGRPYDVRELFFADGDPGNLNSGAFYYWKRKYKYLMARWGWSVNIAAIEPFNELDHMLGFREHDLSSGGQCDVCPENQVDWPAQPQLPGIIDQWFTALSQYIRDPALPAQPENSPLGESDKLLACSFGMLGMPVDYYDLLGNSAIDLIDVHRGMGESTLELSSSWEESQLFRSTNPSNGHYKPFNRGEHNYYAMVDADNDPSNGKEYESSKVYLNYDVSFHNEIWASAFFGNYATGTTWHWERIFWWKDGLPGAPHPNNPYQTTPPSNVLNAVNNIDLGLGYGFPIRNRTLYHHFKPLRDFLTDLNIQALGLFDEEYTSHQIVLDPWSPDYECYYMMNSTNDVAIGWVHNMRAYWKNNYWVRAGTENILGCTVPQNSSPTISIAGFPAGDYYVSWFPTRMNTTVCPADYQVSSSGGFVSLQFQPGDFNAITSNWLDTLHSDYAFVVAPFSVKNAVETISEKNGHYDFSIYPNPAHDRVTISLQDDDEIVSIILYDQTGRMIGTTSGSGGSTHRMVLPDMEPGMYLVEVRSDSGQGTKKLIIN